MMPSAKIYIKFLKSYNYLSKIDYVMNILMAGEKQFMQNKKSQSFWQIKSSFNHFYSIF
jgi:hypothetical protein